MRKQPSVPAVALACCLLTLGARVGSAQAPAAAAVPDSLPGRTVVTYVTTLTVYLGAGSQDGLTGRSRVLVMKGGVPIAELHVSYVSWHSASSDFSSDSGVITAGDTVCFSITPAESVVVAPLGLVGGSLAPSLRDQGVRGRVGVSYQMVAPLGSTEGSMSQPALELRAQGARVSGTPLSFIVDARARRTYTSPAISSNDAGTRVYQANVNWSDTRSGVSVTLGRQFSSALSPVSLFDGAAVQLDKSRWGVGTFVGSQPAPVTMGFSTLVREYGAYVRLHHPLPAIDPTTTTGAAAGAAATDPQRWAVTLGGVGSYAGSSINREFLFGQLTYADPRVYLYATQELDYNRGWKRAAGEPTVQATSTLATVQLTLSPTSYLHAGFDNRRAVRLYRDTVTAENQFDDRFRQGAWVGMSMNPSPSLRLGLDARLSSGGPSGSAVVYTGSAIIVPGLPMEAQIRARTTYYTSTTTNGWLVAGAYGFDPLWGLRLELNGGVRLEHPAPGAAAFVAPENEVHWLGLDADLSLGRAWYLVLSATNTNGGAESSNALYSSLSYRF